MGMGQGNEALTIVRDPAVLSFHRGLPESSKDMRKKWEISSCDSKYLTLYLNFKLIYTPFCSRYRKLAQWCLEQHEGCNMWFLDIFKLTQRCYFYYSMANLIYFPDPNFQLHFSNIINVSVDIYRELCFLCVYASFVCMSACACVCMCTCVHACMCVSVFL